MRDAFGKGGLSHWLSRPSRVIGFCANGSREDGVLSPAFPRPSLVMPMRYERALFSSLPAAIKQPTPTATPVTMVAVPKTMHHAPARFIVLCCFMFIAASLVWIRLTCFRVCCGSVCAFCPICVILRFIFELFVLRAPCQSCLATAFPVSPCTRATAFSCCAFSRSARACAFARRLRMFATVSSMP